MIQKIHTAVKGRARYKVKELYRSESLKRCLERLLPKKVEINKVSANPLTGNILVFFKKDISHSKIASLIEEIVSNHQEQEKERPKSGRKSKKAVGGEEQKTEDWHLMAVDAVLDALDTSKESGLSSETAEENLNKYGQNALAESESRSDISILTEQFQSLPVALLGAAAGLSIITGGFADALVIVGVVAVNAAIGYATESQSEKIIHSLKGEETPSALVIRDGNPIEISAEDIVLGDILVLQSGSYVAADARLLETDNLSIDESALTGESIPVTKKTRIPDW